MYYVNAFSYTSNLCAYSIDVAHMCELIQENVHEHACKTTFKWLLFSMISLCKHAT